MKAVRISVSGYVNSFRVPTSHTHQATLPHPPRTTILGLMGAAFGLPPEKCLCKQYSEKFFFSVIETTQNDEKGNKYVSQQAGVLTDLWKYRKYERGVFKTPSVLLRDGLYMHKWDIYIIPRQNENKNDNEKEEISTPTLEEIVQAFENPKWCLSLGREDDLIRISECKIVELMPKKVSQLKRTIVQADFTSSGNFKINMAAIEEYMKKTGSKYVGLKPAFTAKLPRYFIFEQNGARIGAEMVTYSFINSPVGFELQSPIDGYSVADSDVDLVRV